MKQAVKTHYEQTLDLYRSVEKDVIAFGYSALIDIAEGKTIRQMSIDLCGNNGLEDRISRWVQAAEWDKQIKQDNGQLYEDAREWLSPTHFSALERFRTSTDDYEAARDLMEQCLVRNDDGQVTEVKPVQWLRGKTQDPATPSTQTVFHRVWLYATKALPDAQSQLEKLGNMATREDRVRVNVLKLIIKLFAEVK